MVIFNFLKVCGVLGGGRTLFTTEKIPASGEALTRNR